MDDDYQPPPGLDKVLRPNSSFSEKTAPSLEYESHDKPIGQPPHAMATNNIQEKQKGNGEQSEHYQIEKRIEKRLTEKFDHNIHEFRTEISLKMEEQMLQMQQMIDSLRTSNKTRYGHKALDYLRKVVK